MIKTIFLGWAVDNFICKSSKKLHKNTTNGRDQFQMSIQNTEIHFFI